MNYKFSKKNKNKLPNSFILRNGIKYVMKPNLNQFNKKTNKVIVDKLPDLNKTDLTNVVKTDFTNVVQTDLIKTDNHKDEFKDPNNYNITIVKQNIDYKKTENTLISITDLIITNLESNLVPFNSIFIFLPISIIDLLRIGDETIESDLLSKKYNEMNNENEFNQNEFLPVSTKTLNSVDEININKYQIHRIPNYCENYLCRNKKIYTNYKFYLKEYRYFLHLIKYKVFEYHKYSINLKIYKNATEHNKLIKQYNNIKKCYFLIDFNLMEYLVNNFIQIYTDKKLIINLNELKTKEITKNKINLLNTINDFLKKVFDLLKIPYTVLNYHSHACIKNKLKLSLNEKFNFEMLLIDVKYKFYLTCLFNKNLQLLVNEILLEDERYYYQRERERFLEEFVKKLDQDEI